jgi:hypothetical protein
MLSILLAFLAAPAFPPDATPIAAIQGSGARSPLAGQVVTTAGIVTAVRPSSYYIQSPPEWADTDPRTSEGLLIFLGSAPPAGVVPGAFVKVRGTVTEFVSAADPGAPPLTELTRIVETVVLEVQSELPAPFTLTRELLLSGSGLETLEPYEGMRVNAPRVIVTTPTAANGVFFGVLPGFARPIRSRDWDGAPEKLRLDSNRVAPAASAGMSFLDVAGVLDFGQRAWTLVITGFAQLASIPYGNVPLLPPTPREVAIASLNCERFFDTRDDPGVSDTVLSDADYSARKTKLVRFILTTLHAPDVVALMEIENLRVLEEIAGNLNSVARENGLPEPNYRAYLEEGTDPGGIDTGFLVKTSRVQPIDVFQWGRMDTYIRPDGRIETLNERPPLTLYAKVEHRDFIVVANHFRSMTDVEDPVSGPRIRLKRRLQAEQLRDLIARLSADNPGTPIAAVGDFNAFPFPNLPDDDPLAVLRGALELHTFRLPPPYAISYSYYGAGQTIDHIFGNPAFSANLTRLAYTTINTTTPERERLNHEIPDRLSDHEAVMAYFSLDPPVLSPMMVRTFLSPFSGMVAVDSLIEVTSRALPIGQELRRVPLVEGPVYTLSVGGYSIELPLAPALPVIANASYTGRNLRILATGLGSQQPYVTVGRSDCTVESVRPGATGGIQEILAACPDEIPVGVDLPLLLTAAETASLPFPVRK